MSAEASGIDMAGYILGGVAIGGLSSVAAIGVSALGGGAMLAGATAGTLAGAGFSGLSTNWDRDAVLKGAAFGAVSGFVGGGIAASIGGGWGSFAGGAASSGLNTAFNGGNLEQRVHSPYDYLPIDSYVVNRYETTFNVGKTTNLVTYNDPFLRCFPWFIFL